MDDHKNHKFQYFEVTQEVANQQMLHPTILKKAFLDVKIYQIFVNFEGLFVFGSIFWGSLPLPWGNPNFYYQIILAQGLDSNLCRRNPRQPEQQCQAVAGGGVDLQRGKVSRQKIPQQVRDYFRCQAQIQNSPKTRICVKLKFNYQRVIQKIVGATYARYSDFPPIGARPF